MRRYFKIFFLFLLFLFSCKAKKDLPPSAASAKCRLDYKSAKTLAFLLKQNQADYSTFSGKMKTSFVVDNKTTDFTVSMRIRKDSMIWASVSPALGIEVMRIAATKDSIKFLDRLHNNYFTGDYDTLSRMLHTEIDLEILQSLLTGNSVEFYEEDEKLRAGIDSCKYILGTIRKRKLRKIIQKGKELKEPAQNIWLLDSTFKIARILFREFETRREFDARFGNFQRPDLPEGQAKPVSMPYNVSYKIKTDNVIIITIEYSKVSVNKLQSFPFSIPEGYERIGSK